MDARSSSGRRCLAALCRGDQRSQELDRVNRVLDNVRRAAEETGRVFFVQYDTAGSDAESWPEAIEADWLWLLTSKKIIDSPAYLHHNGNPVVGITGPGMQGSRPSTPEQTLQFFENLRSESAQGWGESDALRHRSAQLEDARSKRPLGTRMGEGLSIV